jgi:hypothetical protein
MVGKDLTGPNVSKCVKPDGGFYIGKGFLVTVAFTRHNPLQAKRVSHKAIRVLFYDDFDWLQNKLVQSLPWPFEWLFCRGDRCSIVDGRFVRVALHPCE